jgi:hypothetical protein
MNHPLVGPLRNKFTDRTFWRVCNPSPHTWQTAPWVCHPKLLNRYLGIALRALTILVASSTFGQDKPQRIGAIEFFGYSQIDLSRVRATLPFQEGDEFKIETGEEKVNKAREALKR